MTNKVHLLQPLAETHRPFVILKVIKFVICDLKYHLSDHKKHVQGGETKLNACFCELIFCMHLYA